MNHPALVPDSVAVVPGGAPGIGLDAARRFGCAKASSSEFFVASRSAAGGDPHAMRSSPRVVRQLGGGNRAQMGAGSPRDGGFNLVIRQTSA